MKVETDLKAGAFFQGAANAASQAFGDVAGFANKAGQQAHSLTSAMVNKTTRVWNALIS